MLRRVECFLIDQACQIIFYSSNLCTVKIHVHSFCASKEKKPACFKANNRENRNTQDLGDSKDQVFDLAFSKGEVIVEIKVVSVGARLNQVGNCLRWQPPYMH